MDMGETYRAARERIGAMVDDSVGDVDVAGTPGWTVHDVVAHLSGIVEDAMSGNMAGAPGPAWTAAQVERARGRSIGEMIEGWSVTAPGFEGLLSSPAGVGLGPPLFDIHTHECDLQHALGLPVALPDEVAGWMGERLLEGFAQRVDAAGLAPVEVRAPAIEVLLGMMGRRTRAEVCNLDWSADPTPYLDEWFIFGVRDEPLER